MPISVTHPINVFSEQEFHDLDYQMMKLIFKTHNDLRRLFDEKTYQNRLIELCRETGIEVAAEVRIELSHGSFRKQLFIDLLIESGSVYELKAANAISAHHRVQTIGYLFLTNTHHGKIINFRPPSVEYEFVSTTLKHADRRAFSLCDKDWEKNSESAHRLKILLISILEDWGAFLDTKLYKEAICHLYNNEDILQPVEIKSGSSQLGIQNMPILSPAESFCISSIKTGISTYQTHLQRFLQHTTLKSLHWININNQNIRLQTLSN